MLSKTIFVILPIIISSKPIDYSPSSVSNLNCAKNGGCKNVLIRMWGDDFTTSCRNRGCHSQLSQILHPNYEACDCDYFCSQRGTCCSDYHSTCSTQNDIFSASWYCKMDGEQHFTSSRCLQDCRRAICCRAGQDTCDKRYKFKRNKCIHPQPCKRNRSNIPNGELPINEIPVEGNSKSNSPKSKSL